MPADVRPQFRVLGEVLSRWATERGDDPALVFGDRTWTWDVCSPEVERVVAEFPGVAEVAVIGVPDDRWGEQVKAVVTAVPGAQVDAEKLIEYCRERLAHYKCPCTVDVREALPRNETGKILKRKVREPYWQGHSRRV
ncbi:AMP-binding enzyme [Amycolatopsis sulphurea]|uniref:AMP-binding enzyme n=1 Tax=Amycolatopsis sulphurea TaxID=76022 RepID=UPI001FE40D59|nr:hypothetical protein [Amycolatopsis sulphurea]